MLLKFSFIFLNVDLIVLKELINIITVLNPNIFGGEITFLKCV